MEMRPYGVDVGCGYFGFLDTDMVRAPESDEILAQEEFANARRVRPAAPVSKGVERIVRGIEGRSRRVYYPPWIIAPLLAPAPFQRLIELGMARRGVFERSGSWTSGRSSGRRAPSERVHRVGQPVGGDGGAQLGHQAGHEGQVVQRHQPLAQQLAGLEQVAQVRARVAARAGRACAALEDRLGARASGAP